MTAAVQDSDRDAALAEFLGPRGRDRYSEIFDRIGECKGFVWTLNRGVLLLGPIWYGMRGIWIWMLVFTLVESVALILIGRGIWADLAMHVTERIASVEIQLELRQAQLEAAIENGAANVDALRRNIDGLNDITTNARDEVELIEQSRTGIILVGLAVFAAGRLLMAVLANIILAKRFSNWLSTRETRKLSDLARLAIAAAFVLGVLAINFAHYVLGLDVMFLSGFPDFPGIRRVAVDAIESAFDFLTIKGDELFDGISFVIRLVLDFLETIFVETPWIVIATFLVAVTALSANFWAAVIAALFLAYIGAVGLWTLAMQTLALLGTAACISISLGIPLGIYSARRPRVYRLVRPVLDMQQTVPTFVYMIPVIAFFGTGKAAAVVTCLIFGMPPVVRLTVLGIQSVPESIREAAVAFGASEWYLMTRIELPLAAPSIRAGINQTILLSLLTVVVASLIGAKGLGEDVLEALQYASIGQGLLAGLAILFLAKILDRIFMGNRHGV